MATRAGGAVDGFEQVLPPRRPSSVPRAGRLPGRISVPCASRWTLVTAGVVAVLLVLAAATRGDPAALHRFDARKQVLLDVGLDATPEDVVADAYAGDLAPGEERWDALLPAVRLDERVFAGVGRSASLGFACHRAPIPHADRESLSITRFEPVVTRPDAVHHITVFACHARVAHLWPEVFFGRGCAAWDFAKATDGHEAPCRVVIYAYDKGAAPFLTPPRTAVKVGRDTGLTHVVFQVHYLVPEEPGDARPAPWPDSSGVRFNLARGDAHDNRPVSLGLLGAMHTRMSLPAGSESHAFEYTLGPFRERLAPDFARAAAEGGRGAVTLVAAHLHGHGMLRRYETGLVRWGWGEKTRDGAREVFATMDPYGGYGDAQSYHPLPLRATSARAGDGAGVGVELGPEDVMWVRCVFDTRSKRDGDAVRYGVGHGEEMCGQLVYYHPFVTTQAGSGGGVRRPEPREAVGERDNDLFNVFFNTTTLAGMGEGAVRANAAP